MARISRHVGAEGVAGQMQGSFSRRVSQPGRPPLVCLQQACRRDGIPASPPCLLCVQRWRGVLLTCYSAAGNHRLCDRAEIVQHVGYLYFYFRARSAIKKRLGIPWLL
jgi:hypothetical protein